MLKQKQDEATVAQRFWMNFKKTAVVQPFILNGLTFAGVHDF